mmetsp:Transcript_37983/g.62391  ORF Transcript_37983/g.62391 Transcript_37983/m.62391 type:complete len:255 (+) Transcript_37983:405-1169(+)
MLAQFLTTHIFRLRIIRHNMRGHILSQLFQTRLLSIAQLGQISLQRNQRSFHAQIVILSAMQISADYARRRAMHFICSAEHQILANTANNISQRFVNGLLASDASLTINHWQHVELVNRLSIIWKNIRLIAVHGVANIHHCSLKYRVVLHKISHTVHLDQSRVVRVFEHADKTVLCDIARFRLRNRFTTNTQIVQRRRNAIVRVFRVHQRLFTLLERSTRHGAKLFQHIHRVRDIVRQGLFVLRHVVYIYRSTK